MHEEEWDSQHCLEQELVDWTPTLCDQDEQGEFNKEEEGQGAYPPNTTGYSTFRGAVNVTESSDHVIVLT